MLSLPLNLITAVTGQGFGLNVFAEMICGFILPGLPGKERGEKEGGNKYIYAGSHFLYTHFMLLVAMMTSKFLSY